MSVLIQPADEISSRPLRTGRGLAAFGAFLHTVAYALWLGGLIGIGALVAPNAAHVIHSYPAFASDESAQKAILTGIIGGSLRVFNYVCYVAGVLMLVGGALELRGASPEFVRLTQARMMVAALLLLMATYLGFGLFPLMDAAQASGQMARFDAMHKQYEWVSQAQLIPLLLIAAITACRDMVVNR